jgi:dTDP-4-dehydrorhamnose 3,5-epimerase
MSLDLAGNTAIRSPSGPGRRDRGNWRLTTAKSLEEGWRVANKPVPKRPMTSLVQLILPKRHGDVRGWLTETYNRDTFAALGITCTFIQDNHSLSLAAFTLRGLHFQVPDRGQDKLVRCIRGRIFDVAVDVRRGSPTYGRWVGAELSAENGHQLFIPIGFAHGFVTLEHSCEVTYKCSDTYAPQQDGGIRWNDPALTALGGQTGGIDWQIPAGTTPELSPKDAVQPLLADFHSPFSYDGRPLAPLA